MSNTPFSWQETNAFVYGATSGLATSTLTWLASQGVSLVLHGRDEDALATLSQTHGEQVQVLTVAGDITSPSLPEAMWEAGQKTKRVPQLFLCFVGIPGRLKPDEWTPQALADIFAINCSGPLLACRHWAEQLKAGSHCGNAVLLSTMQACYPFEGSMPYSLGKIALQGGVELLAKEFGGAHPICVNAIAPGVNEAGMALASIQRGKYKPYLDDQRIARYGVPEDIQQGMALLLQPGLYMTGQTLLMDGGLTLRRDL